MKHKLIILLILSSCFLTKQSVTAQTIATIAGNGVATYSGDGSAATTASIAYPMGVCMDATGNFYIADNYNNCIRKINTSGIISTVAGTGTVAGFGGDGGQATAAMLNGPSAVAVDATGNIYIADLNNNRIRKVNTSGVISTIAGTGVPGFSGDGGAATSAKLQSPFDVVVDASGNIVVADLANNRIRKINTSGVISTIAGHSPGGYSGDGGAATSGNLNYPAEIAYDLSGNLYIVDNGNNVIRKVNTSGIITTVAGSTSGAAGFGGDGGAATAALLNSPTGIAVDATGNLYISDGSNNRIREVHTSGIINTIAGNGTAGYSGDGGAAISAEISNPYSAVLDPAGNFYFADYANNRIRKLGNVTDHTPSFTGGHLQTLTVCENSGAANLNILLQVFDADTAQTETWSVAMGATHGSLSVAYTTTSTGSTLTPTGMIYTPATGFSGNDSFKVQISDGFILDTTLVRVVVNPIPYVSIISGAGTVCVSSTTTITDSASGGTWSASNSFASISSGLLTGFSAGIDTISYTITSSCGTATATKIITVNPVPVAGTITGTASVCVGNTIALTDTLTGGTWHATNTNATVIAGTVTGNNRGIDTIIYSVTNSCGTVNATKVITVNAIPVVPAITGLSSVCPGVSITLFDTTTGGSWNLSNALASISGTTVTGISAGIDTVRYIVTNMCGADTAIHAVTILPLPDTGTITGPTSVCIGSSIVISDASPGGVWGISNGHATFSSLTISGVSVGIDTIIYTVTNTCASLAAHKVITILPLPYAGGISGISTLCAGGTTITLTDTVSSGIWSSSSTIATVASGVVSGLSAGIDTIKYAVTNSCGTAIATHIITINPAPYAGGITGVASVCISGTTTLTDTISGGTWSASNTRATVIAGLVTGAVAGTDTISYTVTNSCGTAYATRIVTVNPTTTADTIAGSTFVCTTDSILLSDATTGGIWSVSNVNAAISSTGRLTGITAGIDTVSYTVIGSCGTAMATKIITVGILPVVSGITGAVSVCETYSIILSDSTTGGVWTSSNTNAFVIGDSVIGNTSGIDTIRYAVTNTCGTTTILHTITINPMPHPGIITGSAMVCSGLTDTLNNTVSGGVWGSFSTSVTTISTTGIVTALAAGTDSIYYTLTNTCGSTTVSFILTVNTAPAMAGTIIGITDSVCPADTIMLSDAVSGGIWLSSATGIASVNSGGLVVGNHPGLDTIVYKVSNSCGSDSAMYPIVVRNPSECPNGIEVIKSQASKLIVFPNPNKGIFTITIHTELNEPAYVIITNILGTTVLEETISTNIDTEMKLNSCAKGTYIMTATVGLEKYYSKIIVE